MISSKDLFEAVLLIGPTGSGKTPLGDYIQQQGLRGRRCLHFDFGHQLRSIADSKNPPGTFSLSEHLFVRDVLEKGLLLEDEHFSVAEKIVRNFLSERHYKEDDLIILNGLPRHAGQACDMACLMNVTGLLVLECTAEGVHERIATNAGGDRTERTDDDVEMIGKKLDIFRQRTEPLVEHYRALGSSIHKIPVSAVSTSETVYKQITSFF